VPTAGAPLKTERLSNPELSGAECTEHCPPTVRSGPLPFEEPNPSATGTIFYLPRESGADEFVAFVPGNEPVWELRDHDEAQRRLREAMSARPGIAKTVGAPRPKTAAGGGE
jgi:hypothetical protein